MSLREKSSGLVSGVGQDKMTYCCLQEENSDYWGENEATGFGLDLKLRLVAYSYLTLGQIKLNTDGLRLKGVLNAVVNAHSAVSFSLRSIGCTNSSSNTRGNLNLKL